MRWAPERLAGFAADAGWRPAELAEAVAVALATSSGDSAYRWRVDPGPIIDQRGLWGLDVIEWPDLAGEDLFNPTVNATEAHMLYTAHGGDWSWHPVWRTGIPPAVAQAALRAARAPSRVQSPTGNLANGSPGSLGERFAQIAGRAMDRLAQPFRLDG